MKSDFLLGIGVGVLAAYFWRKVHIKSGKEPSDMTLRELANVSQNVVAEEGNKFGEALKKEYDIVMPSDQVVKKVKKRAKELTDGRYAIKADNIKPPISL